MQSHKDARTSNDIVLKFTKTSRKYMGHATIPVSMLKAQTFLEQIIHLQKLSEIPDNRDPILLLNDNPFQCVDKYNLQLNELIKNKYQTNPAA